MYQFTLADARKNLGLKNVSGVASSSDQFVAYLNEVMRRLSKRGDWFGMVQRMRICYYGCNVTWPRCVGTVIAMRNCYGNVPMRNIWFPFTGQLGYGLNSVPDWYSFMGGWSQTWAAFGGILYGGANNTHDIGTAPTYNDVSGNTGKTIRYFVVKQGDLGKKITLYGTQYGGQPLQEFDPVSGTWKDGLTITAANPYGASSVLVTRIDAITREATEGMTYLYEYDVTSNTMVDLAQYQPTETNPRYRRSKVVSPDNYFSNSSSCQHSVEALVKLQFIPVVDDRDFLMVDDFDALKLGIQAIKCEEANDTQTAELKWTAAIRELNFRDRDTEPDLQTSVTVNVLGGSRMVENPI